MAVATRVEVEPLSPAVGAAVTGVDLNQPVDEETFAVLHQAFLDHCVLVFPDQHLRPEGQDAFARLWGEPLVLPYLASYAVPGFPAVLRVTNMGKEGTYTENWHFDSAYFEEPPAIAILAAQHLPAIGGDTMWANQYLAYEALSPRMQEILSGLKAAYTGSDVDDDGERRPIKAFHPVVRTHPETGRKALATGRPESVPHFEGMTPEESRPLLEFLYHHASRPEFVYRHHWSQGDVVMWDNRCLLHYAVHDYGDEERNLHRVTVLAEQTR